MWIVPSLALFALCATAAAAPIAGGDAFAKLIEAKAPSIVTVSMVVKTEISFNGQSQNQESREELTGVVVDKSGLIMADYAAFNSEMGEEAGQFQAKRTPTEMKVVFESEEKEYDAELVATDKKLGLAFVKIKSLEGREPVAVSFADAAEPEIGDEVVAVARLEKGYDYAPYYSTAHVSGKLKKPRKALMVDDSLADVGLPVFTLDGKIVGVMAAVESNVEKQERGFPFFMGGGGRRFLLPGRVIEKVIEQAMTQAAEGAKPADPAAPAPSDGEKKPGEGNE